MTINTISLIGVSVNLRPIVVADAQISFAWRQNSNAKYLNRGSINVEDQILWIKSRPDNEVNFIIELKNGEPIGMLSLIKIDLINMVAEPSRFLIGEKEKAKNIPAAAEAMYLLYQFGFMHLGLRRVYGYIASDNKLMIKWQKYMGMTVEGVMREHFYRDGHSYDAIIFGLMRDEYINVTQHKLLSMISFFSNFQEV